MPDQLAGDLLAALEAKNRPKQCKLCMAIEQRSTEDQAALREVCGSKLANETILEILHKHGIEVGRPALVTHRRGSH